MNIPNIRLFAELGLLHMRNVLLEEQVEELRNRKPAEDAQPAPVASEPSSDGIQQ